MDVKTRQLEVAGPPRISQVREIRRHYWLGIASIAFGAGLIANSLLGPLVADAIDYPWSESMRNQAIGLEAISLFLVAPLCIVAGALAIRGHRAAPLLAIGPAAYTAYMFPQYVVGPEYTRYAGILPLHVSLFILGTGVAVASWNATDPERLPSMSRRSERRYAALLFVLAAFILSRYLPALGAAIAGDPIAAEFGQDVSMYWSIFLLDLGLVVPATVAAAIGLLRGTSWARKALYAVFGWFALVPPSVAAMGIVMVIKDDPNASVGQAIVLSVAAVAFATLAIRLYRPLFRRAEVR
jgi:hypothetical protein